MPDSTTSISLPSHSRDSHVNISKQQHKEIPSQIKFVRAAQMSLFADVTSWPPLSEVTFLRRAERDGNGDNVCIAHWKIRGHGIFMLFLIYNN